MVLKSLIKTLCAYLLCILVSPVWASTIYTYTGNNFDTFQGSLQSHDSSMNVTLSLEYTDPLLANLSEAIRNPVSFSISDGINTIDNTSMTGGAFYVGTDSTGNIDNWFIWAVSNAWHIETINSTIVTGLVWDYGRNSLEDIASLRDNPASWSVSPVPVPAAIWLFGTALMGLFGYSKRRKSV